MCVFQHTVATPWAWRIDGSKMMRSKHPANGTKQQDHSTPGQCGLKVKSTGF